MQYVLPTALSTASTAFSLNDTLSREMFVTMPGRIAGVDDNNFTPEDSRTRDQIEIFLWAFAK